MAAKQPISAFYLNDDLIRELDKLSHGQKSQLVRCLLTMWMEGKIQVTQKLGQSELMAEVLSEYEGLSSQS